VKMARKLARRAQSSRRGERWREGPEAVGSGKFGEERREQHRGGWREEPKMVGSGTFDEESQE
jgi:hypothetical protein